MYVKLISDTVKKKTVSQKKYFDPVLTTFLRIKEIEYFRNIENFISDKNSCNWATILGCKL